MTDSDQDKITHDGNQETITNPVETFMAYEDLEEAAKFLKGFLRDLSDDDFLQLLADDLPAQDDEPSEKFRELLRAEILYRNATRPQLEH